MQRHGVGLSTDMAADHGNRTELAHRARIAQQDAIQKAPFDVRKRHAEKCLQAGRTKRDGRLFLIAALIRHQRDQFARDEWKGDEDGRKHQTGQREDDLNIMLPQPRPQPTLHTENQHIDQTGNHRRNRKRQIDQRDQKAFAAEIMLGDGPRRRHAEQQVKRYGNGGDNQGQPYRRQGVGVGECIEGRFHTLVQGLRKYRQQRHHKKQNDKSDGERNAHTAHNGTIFGWFSHWNDPSGAWPEDFERG